MKSAYASFKLREASAPERLDLFVDIKNTTISAIDYAKSGGVVYLWGLQILNPGPLAPKASALAGLRYAPMASLNYTVKRLQKQNRQHLISCLFMLHAEVCGWV